jgi:hypothetical protein
MSGSADGDLVAPASVEAAGVVVADLSEAQAVARTKTMTILSIKANLPVRILFFKRTNPLLFISMYVKMVSSLDAHVKYSFSFSDWKLTTV